MSERRCVRTKTLNEKDYTYLGEDGSWHVFESKPKPKFDPERLYLYRVRFVQLNGKSRFFEPVKEK